MIQRIQSIYLVLAGLFPAFTFFVPLVVFSNETLNFTMTDLGYNVAEGTEMASRHPYGLMVWAVCALVLSVVAIFGFKNRKKQMKQVKWGMMMNVLWYVAFIAYAFSVKSRTATELGFEVGCLFPLLSFLLQFVAYKAIKRDDDLVRAADRIR